MATTTTSDTEHSDGSDSEIKSESESPTSLRSFDFTDEIEPNVKRLKRDPSSSSSEFITVSSSSGSGQSDSSPTNSLSLLPLQTHQWDAKHLDTLRIFRSYSPSNDPVNLIKDGLKNILGLEKYTTYLDNKANDPVISDFRVCIASALDHIKLDIEDLSELEIGIVETLKTDLENWKDQYAVRRPKSDLPSIVGLHGQRFADQLRYMLSFMNSKNSRKVPLEGMYQQLFMIFLEMFGLKVYGFSNIGRQYLNIGEMMISSEADILVMDYKNIRNGLEVVTHRMLVSVVEVKRDVLKTEQCTPVRTRSAGKRKVYENIRTAEQHDLSGKSIGQHGGELLCHLPASVFGTSGIFGMLVQASMVSFTSLIPPENYLSALNDGSYKKTKAEFNISKGFNFLSKEGREKLFLPLVELYSLQRILDLQHEIFIPDLK